MTWKEVYQLPLQWKKTTGINVLSKNYVIALTFGFDYFNPSKKRSSKHFSDFIKNKLAVVTE